MIKAEDQKLKATDLRIGNWINVYGIDDEATDIMCDGVNTKTYPCMTYENVHGIELNEEWLIKLGFAGMLERVACSYYYGTNPVTSDWLMKLTKIDGEDHFFYKNGYFKIKTVHQLQNLYHSLTGTELTTKP